MEHADPDQPATDADGPGLGLVEIDRRAAHPARVYDYLLGGVDHFAVDREAAERGASALPGGIERARAMVLAQRLFLVRVVRYLAGEAGVRQFLDVGTGIPNGDNVHAVAQQTATDARVVYVDKDPVVLAHAHELLRSTPDGATDFLHADLRDPDVILSRAAATLDFAEPVAIMLVGVLHLIPDEDGPHQILARLLDAVPAGSYLAVSHLASDLEPELVDVIRRANQTMSEPFVLRTHGEVARLLDGLELFSPGIATVDGWHPPDKRRPEASASAVPAYAALARKPDRSPNHKPRQDGGPTR